MAFGLGKMKIQAVNNVNNVNESDSRSCTFINGRICFQNNARRAEAEPAVERGHWGKAIFGRE